MRLIPRHASLGLILFFTYSFVSPFSPKGRQQEKQLFLHAPNKEEDREIAAACIHEFIEKVKQADTITQESLPGVTAGEVKPDGTYIKPPIGLKHLTSLQNRNEVKELLEILQSTTVRSIGVTGCRTDRVKFYSDNNLLGEMDICDGNCIRINCSSDICFEDASRFQAWFKKNFISIQVHNVRKSQKP